MQIVGMYVTSFLYIMAMSFAQKSHVCNHEEADSRMFHHVAFSTRSTSETINIVVRTVDADCLIIALGCFKRLCEIGSVNLWLEVGLETKKCTQTHKH